MPRQSTPLTDTRIKALKPRTERYRGSDTGVRQPALTIGSYPDISLAAARRQRDARAAL